MMKTKDIVHEPNEILVGYFHNYGITDTHGVLKRFGMSLVSVALLNI